MTEETKTPKEKKPRTPRKPVKKFMVLANGVLHVDQTVEQVAEGLKQAPEAVVYEWNAKMKVMNFAAEMAVNHLFQATTTIVYQG